MKFNRLLTAILMALICAGTAAASQLNSVHVAPKANAATVTLQTTGSFAHKEYRPDEHLLLVDLTGVTSDPTLAHTVAVKCPALKSYAVSSYTNAAGTAVTRIEFSLGDKVTTNVVDGKDGLQIQFTVGAAAPSAAAVPAPAKQASSTRSNPQTNTQNATAAKAVVAKAPAARPAGNPEAKSVEAGKVASDRTTIRAVRVQREQDSINVIVEGPSAATPVQLQNPDRLVLDFSNAVLQAGVRNVTVEGGDVRKVRVGRFHDSPPVIRVVIDLSGPRSFEVVPSADRVAVRIKTEAAGTTAPVKSAAAASAPRVKKVAMPAASSAPAASTQVEPRATDAPAEHRVAHHRAAKAKTSPLNEVAASGVPPAEAEPASPDASAPVAPRAAANSGPEKSEEAKPAAAPVHLVSANQLPDSITGTTSTTVSKPKYTGEPISVNLKDVDLKDFFRLIHEISGLNIVLDPSVRGTVTLVLDDVPWDQALDIVLKNNAMDRELQGNVLRIAASDTLRREAVDRRAQAEAVALAVDRQTVTRTLSYAKAGAAVSTIKKFLTARGDVIADDRTNSLIISDIPSVLPTLDRLISQLDQKTQEVEIEVRVVSATRSFSRDLGFQLGFNWNNGVSTVSGTNPNGASSPVIGAIGGAAASAANSIPLFSNFPAAGATSGIGFSNITKSYGIDAILTAAEAHSLAKVLSRPRVVTQSNVKAEVKQGVKIPVYTSGTANSNSSVTYTDAVLRLSVTPQITADNTIFLIVDVENTQPNGQLNGNFILTTQQASTQVLVTDGGTVVIGGVIQTNNRVSTSQTPVLGDIPWLGNLFKQRSVSTDTEELIFFITPKIIQT